ncbi:MAG: helix-turn-helix transcriptional regulator [Symploca sp. SIO1B1]|nr:helix-turn-helix transcriptional regulator [Symploca sp. SIO1C2]NER52285.1 helix-turn-helix transcriptional regulator [Symploca sp. SIO1A3]NER99162.1 helix-turn-helix transcriptional regulator [Symploca sp. SIO1B1]
MIEQQALDMLSALSHETRLRVVRYLIQCGEQGASAGEVGKQVDAISSRASFHLSALEQAGVISSERQSRKIIYRANLRNIGDLMSFLLNDCCDNHPDIRACCVPENKCC